MKEDERGQSLRGESWRWRLTEHRHLLSSQVTSIGLAAVPRGVQPDSGLSESVKTT